MPRLFVATAVHVYLLPWVTPVTVIGMVVAVLLLVTPPFGDAQVAVKLSIAAPLPAGVTNVTFNDPDTDLATASPVVRVHPL